jgi:Xaa-Pro aminopeptidase
LEVLLDESGSSVATIDDAIPDPGAEVSVAGRDVMAALGMAEAFPFRTGHG